MGAGDIKPGREEEFVCIISGTLVERKTPVLSSWGLAQYLSAWSGAGNCLLSSALMYGLKGKEKMGIICPDCCNWKRKVPDLWGCVVCIWPQRRNISLLIIHWIVMAILHLCALLWFLSQGWGTAGSCGLPPAGGFLFPSETQDRAGIGVLSPGHGWTAGVWSFADLDQARVSLDV